MDHEEQIPRRAGHRWRRLAAFVAVAAAAATAYGAYHYVDAARHSTRQTLCVHNLKHVFLGLEVYAKEHNGQLPDRLSDLWPKYLPGLDVLACPEVQSAGLWKRNVPPPFPPHPSQDDIEALCSYAYVPGHTLGDAADTVIVYEKKDNHFGRGRSLLYLDGHGAWEPPQNWRNGPPNKTLPPGF